ncbi:MAG: hypothetical protein V2J07_04120 [Anaerolineae bacterium]|jgi:hypothetical protein|nr:hypothetical protein [Anaerolineae bacterium]
MEKWFISIVDDSDKRAKLSVPVGILSILLGTLTFFITFLFYPVSAFLAVAGLLMGFTSLDSENGWHAVAGMILNGIGLLGPLVFLGVMLFFPIV